MLQHNLLLIYRNFKKFRNSFFINLIGLSAGLACSVLILLWIKDEMSYDRFHANAERLYRITCSTDDIKAAVTSAPMAAAIKFQMPEIKNTVRLINSTDLFQVGTRKFEEKQVFYADESFLEMFSFPLLKGDVKTALHRPDGILITEKMAKKYFGQEDALGKTILKDNKDNFTVTGILADIPANSHLQFDFILPITFLAETNTDLKNNRWSNFNFYTYAQLDHNVDISDASLQKLNKRITNIYKANETRVKVNFQLQPVSNIHLHSNLLRDSPGNGSIQYVYIFFSVALFILMIACINFMNLATARSARRAKEIGLRKIVGAKRSQLIVQFLGESTFISFLALILAIAIVWISLPAFNDITNKKFTINLLNGVVIFYLFGVALMTGLLSGIYPALFLSGFKPIKILKGNIKLSGGNIHFRNGLVVSQFMISITLLVGTLVVYDQLEFIRNRNLGFDKENLLYMSMTGDLWDKQQSLKSALKENPLTSNYTITQGLPTNLISGSIDVQWDGKNPQSQPVFPDMAVDENFIDIFKIKILNGRGFSKEFKADTANYIVNEKAVQVMGMDVTTAVGKSLAFWGTKGRIIGVVKDFNFKPIQQAMEPLILRFNTWGGKVVVRARPGTTAATIQALENISKKLNPDYPFSYSFLDQDLDNLYRGEQRMGKIFNVFAILAIFISCLGLYGLSAFTAEQRTKEIGVRKVLGASISQVVYLLLKSYTKLIIIALFIAVPVSWIIMNSWLNDFAYHINFHWSIFLVAGLTALLTAWLTVGYESVKAALTNPVKSIRTE